MEKIPVNNCIQLYFHCSLCLKQKPSHISPKEYQQIQAGWTKQGIQIWCTRHDINIAHIDLNGNKVTINTGIKEANGNEKN